MLCPHKEELLCCHLKQAETFTCKTAPFTTTLHSNLWRVGCGGILRVAGIISLQWTVLQSILHDQKRFVCVAAVWVRMCVWHAIGPKCLGITLWCACQIRLSSHTTYQCGSTVPAPPAEVWREQHHGKQVVTSSNKNRNVAGWLNYKHHLLLSKVSSPIYTSG